MVRRVRAVFKTLFYAFKSYLCNQKITDSKPISKQNSVRKRVSTWIRLKKMRNLLELETMCVIGEKTDE